MGSGAQGFRGRGRGGGARRVREVALSRTCACSGIREPRSGHMPKVTQPEAKVFPAPSAGSRGRCYAQSTLGLPPAGGKSPSPPGPPLLALPRLAPSPPAPGT